MNQANTVSCFGRDLRFEGFCFALCNSRKYPYISQRGPLRGLSIEPNLFVKENKKMNEQLKPD